LPQTNVTAFAASNPFASRQLGWRTGRLTATRKLDEIVAIPAFLGDDGLLPEHLKEGFEQSTESPSDPQLWVYEGHNDGGIIVV
jgi:hypothetical protein